MPLAGAHRQSGVLSAVFVFGAAAPFRRPRPAEPPFYRPGERQCNEPGVPQNLRVAAGRERAPAAAQSSPSRWPLLGIPYRPAEKGPTPADILRALKATGGFSTSFARSLVSPTIFLCDHRVVQPVVRRPRMAFDAGVAERGVNVALAFERPPNEANQGRQEAAAARKNGRTGGQTAEEEQSGGGTAGGARRVEESLVRQFPACFWPKAINLRKALGTGPPVQKTLPSIHLNSLTPARPNSNLC